MRTFLISVNKSEVLNAMCTFEQFWENMTYGERANKRSLLVFSKHQGWRQWASSGKIVQVRELTKIAFENWNS